MRDDHAELWDALAAPFRPDQISHRPGGEGRSLAYLTARDVMDRLDDVLGPSNWWDDYQPIDGAVICRLTIRLPDGSTITKTDAGGDCSLDDDGDARKGSFSDALKRAAVRFGIGRHLEAGPRPASREERRERREERGGRASSSSPLSSLPATHSEPARGPATGRALFGWAKERNLLDELSTFGAARGFPRRVVDWTAEQVAEYRDDHPRTGPEVYQWCGTASATSSPRWTPPADHAAFGGERGEEREERGEGKASSSLLSTFSALLAREAGRQTRPHTCVRSSPGLPSIPPGPTSVPAP